MDVSSTQFRAQCLELIRQVKAGGDEVRIRRHGRVVARLSPHPGHTLGRKQPWQALHGSGQLQVAPEDCVFSDSACSGLQ
jgi:antitoxin (DNA-binding transcriptional repressor) of toxin-antitoxin stability system